MFYSQFILAKKGPLGTIWIAAHLERKLRKNQVTETNISVSVDSILFPEVPIALRLSGHLLLGVVRIYSRKVNYLFHDCSEALVKIKQAFHAGAVDLPPEAATAPFHSITLPETFDLDEFEPLLDRELNLLHSNGGNDHHVSSREQITLQDPLEDNSYLGSQFELDERFPEAEAPRMGLDFDEDLLDKGTRETSPAAVTLEEEEEMALEEDVIPPTAMDAALDYDQMDRMDTLDMDDDHQEPATPGLSIDHMDLDYQHEVDVQEEFDQSHRSPAEMEQLEPDFRVETDELEGDKFEQVEGEKFEQLEGEEKFEQLEGEDKLEQLEGEEKLEQLEGEKFEQLEGVQFEQLEGEPFEQLEGGENFEQQPEEKDEEEAEKQDLELEVEQQQQVEEEEAVEREVDEETLNREIEKEFFGEDVDEQQVLDREVEEEFFGKDMEEDMNIEAEQQPASPDKQQDGVEDLTEQQQETGAEGEQDLHEGVEGEKEWEGQDEFQKDVPEYETVMSAPEPTDQEPDVFDMDNDMRSEEVPPLEYQDGDVVMEDREEPEPVLEEEAIPELHEDAPPAASMADPESPGYPPLPAISSDDLPGDDDVLASLLGRGTPALKVIPTPTAKLAPKPRKRQNLKKRKILVDMTTILGAEVMKQQLMNTDDIRRVRRKAACTRQELWSMQKENLGHQIFSENSVPGICGELRGLFEHVYVVGEAKLPLAEPLEPYVVASEEVPERQPSPVVKDLNTDLNEVAEQPAEVAVEDEQVQVPAKEYEQEYQQDEYQQVEYQQVEYQQVNEEEPVAEEVHGEGALHVSTEEETHAEDQPVATSPAHAVDETAPISPLQEAAADVEHGEAKTLNLNNESLDMAEADEYHPTAEYETAAVAGEENPIEERESELVEEEEVHAPEFVDPISDTAVVPVAETELESAVVPVAETEVQTEVETEFETQVESDVMPVAETEVEGAIVPVTDVFGEPQPQHERELEPEPLLEPEDEAGPKVEEELGTGTEMVVEDEFGTGTEIVVEDEFGTGTQMVVEDMIYDEGAVQPEAETQFEEIKPQEEEEPMAVVREEHVEEKLELPVAEEVEIAQEQPEEELGFLADTRDTEFLGADDDDLVEEAEDFQDAKEYGRKEHVQDNSGWSARTRAVGHYLRTTLEDKAVYMKKRQEQGSAKLGLERMLVGKTRKEAARMFFETLVLKTKDYIHVEQDAPYGDIQISARPKLLKAKF